jgi:hypothetical protein
VRTTKVTRACARQAGGFKKNLREYLGMGYHQFYHQFYRDDVIDIIAI